MTNTSESEPMVEPALEVEEESEAQDEYGNPVRVIKKARLTGVSIVDPRRRHTLDEAAARRRKPQ